MFPFRITLCFAFAMLSIVGHAQPVLLDQIGGGGSDYIRGLALDAEGNIFYGGTFQGSIAVGSQTLTAVGAVDSFIAKRSAAGEILWSLQLKGDDTHLEGITIDPDGNVLATGNFYGKLNVDGLEVSSAGSHDIFIIKVAPSGSLVWIRRFGSAGSERTSTIASNGDGSVVIGGYFTGQFAFGDTTISADVGDEGIDGLLLKLDRDGQPVWSTKIGAAGFAVIYDLKTDAANNVYITGGYDQSAIFANTILFSRGGGNWGDPGDIFVAKYSADGRLTWVRSAGGSESDGGRSLSVSDKGDVAVVGTIRGTANFGPAEVAGSGNTIFIAEYSSDGVLRWAKSYPLTHAWASKRDSQGNIIVVGQFLGTAILGTNTLTARDWDGYVLTVDTNGVPIDAWSGGGSSGEAFYAVAGRTSTVVAGVVTSANATFGPLTIASKGREDAVVIELRPRVHLVPSHGFSPTRGFRVTLHGEPGRTYRIDVSADLQTWSPLKAVQLSEATSVEMDAAATNFPARRFYRAILAP